MRLPQSLTTRAWISGIIVLVFSILLAARHQLKHKPVPWQSLPARDLPATYLNAKSYARVNSRPRGSPDTTAIILNWSRLPNVIRIVRLLCSARLEHTIKEVVVWNNNPTQVHPRVRLASFKVDWCLVPTSIIGFRECRLFYCQTQDRELSRKFVFSSAVHSLRTSFYTVLLYPGQDSLANPSGVILNLRFPGRRLPHIP